MKRTIEPDYHRISIENSNASGLTESEKKTFDRNQIILQAKIIEKMAETQKDEPDYAALKYSYRLAESFDALCKQDLKLRKMIAKIDIKNESAVDRLVNILFQKLRIKKSPDKKLVVKKKDEDV